MSVRSFEEVVAESTCQKRVTVCEIFDADGNLLSRESNRCNPKDHICQRLGVTQNKQNYDTESTCNWTHAEINAITKLPKDSKPYRAIIYGHSFYCDPCENALRSIGCKILEIQPVV